MGGRNEQAHGRPFIGAIGTTRKVGSLNASTATYDSTENTTAYNECDTNADTGVAGANFAILAPTHRTADVYP
jgi:hypothetical protein